MCATNTAWWLPLLSNWSPCIADSYIHIHRGKKTFWACHQNITTFWVTVCISEKQDRRVINYLSYQFGTIFNRLKKLFLANVFLLYIFLLQIGLNGSILSIKIIHILKKIRWNFVNYSESVFWSIRVMDFRLSLFNNFIFISDLTHQNSPLKILQFLVIKWEKNKDDNL